MRLFLLCLAWVVIYLIFRLIASPYDKRGFNRKGIHKNGTRYDDEGYDKFGFDINGFDINGYDRTGYDVNGCDKDGYDRKGYDADGYNEYGYNICGKDREGRYHRYYDIDAFSDNDYSKDGFLNPERYPVAVTAHARERMRERLSGDENISALRQAREAYYYGRSKRQLMKTSAALLKDIESRHDDNIALIHKGYIYIFSKENVLITVFKNESIPL